MRKVNLTFYDLVNIVNDANQQNSDVIIAKALVENRYQLDDLSLDRLSEKYYLSQASISRFIKKLGFKNYAQFKKELALSLKETDYIHPEIKNKSTQNIVDETKEDIQKTLDFFTLLDKNTLETSLRYFNQYQNIYFFGSKLSISIVHLLQQLLLSLKKNVYTLYDSNYQKETLQHLSDTDLVICISLEGRWLNFISEDLNNTKATKVLWAPKNSEYPHHTFNEKVYLGDHSDNNMGYHYLMYYVLMIYKLLLNHSKIE